VASPRLKVLDLRDTHEIGGPGKTILETYRAIDASRFELHLGVFLARGETEDTPFINAARALGMPVHVIRGHNQYDPRLIWRTARLIRTLGIDIVHPHEVKSDVISYLATWPNRVPIVTTVHGWIANSAKQRVLMALDSHIIGRFDRVIVVSQQIGDHLRMAGAPDGRMRLIHNAIVIGNYRRTGHGGYIEGLIGRPLSGPVVSSIGRLSPEKGHTDLIDAVAIVRSRGHALSLVLAGDGPDRARIEGRITALGLDACVYLPGYVSQPARVLEESDLAVLPSHTEGLPNAALEAMAMEVPLLATRVGGTPEVVTDGQTGRLVEPRSPEALAAGIIDFMTAPEPWRVMAKRARGLVEAQFNFDARTRAIEALYAEMVAGRP
jgi:glycosyltransferase involved in cell wall biosynthesis